MTFIIMLYLMFIDLLPEIIEEFEILENKVNFFLMFISIGIGFFLLKGIDYFIPEHHHNHKEEHDDLIEHNNHHFHIGFITALSLIIHNVLEGISIYIAGTSDLKTGLVMALSVGCHNLPLGMEIAANMEATTKNKITKYITFFLLVFSSFLGAFFLFIINQELNKFIEGILMSITLGMLLYISGVELIPEVIKNKKEATQKIGLLVGMIVSILLFLI